VRVVVAGDSLALPRPANVHTWRPGTGEELAVRTQDTYAYLLERDLRRRLVEDCEVVNRAVRMRTMPEIAADNESLVHFFEPDALVVQVGIVDCWPREHLGWQPLVPLPQFLDAFLTLVAHVQLRPQTRLVVVGPCPTSRRMEAKAPGVQEAVNRYAAALDQVTRELGFDFLDMRQHVDPDDPEVNLLPDGSHLNRAGNRLVADELLRILLPGH